MKLRTFVVFIVSAVLALSTAACERAQTPAEQTAVVPFVLGFLPSQRAAEIIPDAEKLAAFLSERMGRPVQAVVPTAYEPLIEGLRFGHVDAAFLDGGPAWFAHRRSDARVVLAEVKDGATHYWAEAFVKADSPVTTLADLAGRRAAFTSRTGSSGFLMPIGSMIDLGLIAVPEQSLAGLERGVAGFFSGTVDAGGYEQALRAVLDGRADVAFGAHDAPDRFLPEADRARLRVLHRFGTIPSHAVVVASKVSAEDEARFRAAMLALNEPENLPLLRAIYGVDGLETSNTAAHLADFGRALERLPGIDRSILSKARR